MAKSNDADLINQAYQDEVKNIFSVFCGAYSIANTDAEIAGAVQRFQRGISLTRKARDLAIAKLP